MSDHLSADDEWSSSTEEGWLITDEEYNWETTVQGAGPLDENTQLSSFTSALWECVPQFPDWMTNLNKLESTFVRNPFSRLLYLR